MVDRDKVKRGEKLHKVTGSEERRLLFRNMFIDKRDLRATRTATEQ